jgi:flotillin
MEARQSEAKGESAKILEDGKATVNVLEEMIRTWQDGGESARDIFLMQKLQNVMSSLVDTISGIHVDKLTILPGQNSTAAKSVKFVEELKAGIGVDLPALANRVAPAAAPSEAVPPPPPPVVKAPGQTDS